MCSETRLTAKLGHELKLDRVGKFTKPNAHGMLSVYLQGALQVDETTSRKSKMANYLFVRTAAGDLSRAAIPGSGLNK
jgi:hypothetical protein